jgi:hypothetical protein
MASRRTFADHQKERAMRSPKPFTVYQPVPGQNPKVTEQVFAAWAQGFMTSFNFSTVRERHFRDMTDQTIEAQNEHIRLYCNGHPSASFVQAVLDFFALCPTGQ